MSSSPHAATTSSNIIPLTSSLIISTSHRRHHNPCHHTLLSDCTHIVLKYHLFYFRVNKEGIMSMREVSHLQHPLGEEAIRLASPDWNFLQIFGHSLEFIRSYNMEAEGTIDNPLPLLQFLHQCRHPTLKFTYHYLEFRNLGNGVVHKVVHLLRGVPRLDLPEYLAMHGRDETESVLCMETIMENIRGVQHLDLNLEKLPLPAKCFESLRGLRELKLSRYRLEDLHQAETLFESLRGVKLLELVGVEVLPHFTFLHHLRGVETLKISDCNMSQQDFHNLRGIRSLLICSLEKEFLLTDEVAKHLRGIKELHVDDMLHYKTVPPEEAVARITDSVFKQLRGIRTLFLSSSHAYRNITDAAFSNLRGIQCLTIGGFPQVTDSIFQHLRGIEELHIQNCPNILFSADTLIHLRGMRYLYWNIDGLESLFGRGRNSEKHLDDACLKELCGVNRLNFDNVEMVASSDGFRHLKHVEQLYLEGKKNYDHTVPLQETAFSHLENVKRLYFRDLILEVNDFSKLLQESMPKLQELTITTCRVWKSSLESLEGQELDRFLIHDRDEKYVCASFKMRSVEGSPLISE